MLVYEGRQHLLDLFSGRISIVHLQMYLFSNAYAVIPTTTKANLTDAANVLPQPFQFPTPATIVASTNGQTVWASMLFTNTGGVSVTVTGWYVYDDMTGLFWAAGNFSAPINIASGAAITINPFAQDNTL